MKFSIRLTKEERKHFMDVTREAAKMRDQSPEKAIAGTLAARGMYVSELTKWQYKGLLRQCQEAWDDERSHLTSDHTVFQNEEPSR